MYKCTINNVTYPVKEWYFGIGDNYVKFIDTEYSLIDKLFAKNTIIRAVKITDDTSESYIEDYDVYLTRKMITVSNEDVSVTTLSEEGTPITNQENKEVITVFLGMPAVDTQIDNIADYVGYIENPDSLSLEDYKNYAINQSKTTLANYLLQNPLQSNVHGNTPKHYAITENKQILLLLELTCALQAQELEIPYQPSWNASGEACTYDWTVDELRTLAFQINQVVKPLISYQQTVEEQIIEKSSIDEIKAIEIDFDAHDPRNTQSEDQTDEESTNQE